ncbi:MAG: OmpA family protein [Candidatus Dactylopiibacterium sp.]|nr:OmpA family protein [Candidatus Dactylopiibacterium sp.]
MQDDDDIELKVVAVLMSALILACVLGVVSYGVIALNTRSQPVFVDGQMVPVGDALAAIYFETGSAKVPGEAGGAIQTVKEDAAEAPRKTVLISGFHDPSGDPGRNIELARARAEAVRDALIRAGVPEDRIVLRKPEVIPGTEDLQEARRVDIRLQ